MKKNIEDLINEAVSAVCDLGQENPSIDRAFWAINEFAVSKGMKYCEWCDRYCASLDGDMCDDCVANQEYSYGSSDGVVESAETIHRSGL